MDDFTIFILINLVGIAAIIALLVYAVKKFEKSALMKKYNRWLAS